MTNNERMIMEVAITELNEANKAIMDNRLIHRVPTLDGKFDEALSLAKRIAGILDCRIFFSGETEYYEFEEI